MTPDAWALGRLGAWARPCTTSPSRPPPGLGLDNLASGQAQHHEPERDCGGHDAQGGATVQLPPSPSITSTSLQSATVHTGLLSSIVDTPYLGQWFPDEFCGLLTIPEKYLSDGRRATSFSAPLVSPVLLSALASVLIRAHADSGCSGSLTPHRGALTNLRPCGDRFKAADGRECTAVAIGDLPATATDSTGRRVKVLFRNVRLVPDFKYTLLSVRQLWHEQRIDARFADVNALVVATDSGELRIPFSPSSSLPTVALTSDATAATGGVLIMK